MALERCLRRGIRFLQLDAPLAQVLQGNLLARHGTADVVAGRQDLEFAVQVPDARLTMCTEQLFEPIHFR